MGFDFISNTSSTGEDFQTHLSIQQHKNLSNIDLQINSKQPQYKLGPPIVC
jgi:hypothetical protein